MTPKQFEAQMIKDITSQFELSAKQLAAEAVKMTRGPKRSIVPVGRDTGQLNRSIHLFKKSDRYFVLEFRAPYSYHALDKMGHIPRNFIGDNGYLALYWDRTLKNNGF